MKEDLSYQIERPHTANPLSIVTFGAGTIGQFMAREFAAAGHQVSLVDPNPEALARAMEQIRQEFKNDAFTPSQAESLLNAITPLSGEITDSEILNVLVMADAIIEAIPERSDLKRALAKQLDTLTAPSIPIMSTSSSTGVSEIAEGLVSIGRFINTHPLQRGMAAIELAPSHSTDPDITNYVRNLFEEIHMVPIDALKESQGFIFNIVWRGIKKNTLDLIQRGITTAPDFDRIWMMAFKTTIGPFGLMDRMGLDVVRDIENNYARTSGNPLEKCPEFIEVMIADGKLGLKSGQGFYSYPNPAYQEPGFIERGLNNYKGKYLTPVRDTLIGSWELVSYRARDESGTLSYPMGQEAGGRLMYAANGDMSVSLNSSSRQNFASPDPLAGTPGERTAAYSTFFSYYGKFRYGRGQMFHDVEQCTFPNWNSIALFRKARLNQGGELILATEPVEVAGTISVQELIWKKRP